MSGQKDESLREMGFFLLDKREVPSTGLAHRKRIARPRKKVSSTPPPPQGFSPHVPPKWTAHPDFQGSCTHFSSHVRAWEKSRATDLPSLSGNPKTDPALWRLWAPDRAKAPRHGAIGGARVVNPRTPKSLTFGCWEILPFRVQVAPTNKVRFSPEPGIWARPQTVVRPPQQTKLTFWPHLDLCKGPST